MAEVQNWISQAIRIARLAGRTVAGSLRENVTLGLLAVSIAVALWLFVVEEENPRTTVDITPAVRVRSVNVPEGLAPLGPSEPVAVRVSAPLDIAQRLTSADFRATIDLSGLSLGIYELPTQVEHVGGGHGVRIVQIVPSRVSVSLQPLASVTAPVRAEIERRPPVGFEAAETVAVEPTTAKISGPEELVSRVLEVVARVDLSQATDDTQASVALIATNGSGLVIDGVTIDPSRVRVRIDVRQTLFERIFAVTPRIKGNPAPGYMISGIETQPGLTLLQGPLGALDRLDAAYTEEIDIGGAITDVTRNSRVELPAGVRPRSALDQVQVRIRIVPTTGRAVFTVAPTLENVGDGLQARSQVGLVEIEVEGPVPQIRATLPGQLTALANLANLGVGRHDVTVTGRVPDSLRIIAVRPDRIAVEVQRR